jgi:hypothetical protein
MPSRRDNILDDVVVVVMNNLVVAILEFDDSSDNRQLPSSNWPIQSPGNPSLFESAGHLKKVDLCKV